MKYRVQILGFLILVIIHSCGLDNQTNNESKVKKTETNIFDKYSNDSIRSVIFEIAYNNRSTAPNYIVFKAKDLNTGIIKEICCEAPFLSGAIHRELNIKYGTKGTEYIDSTILANRQEIFEFRKRDALENISFEEYPNYDRIIQIAKELDLEKYHKNYGRNELAKMMYFETDTGFVQETFTHIMFNCGILTRRDCEAGNNIWFGINNEK